MSLPETPDQTPQRAPFRVPQPRLRWSTLSRVVGAVAILISAFMGALAVALSFGPVSLGALAPILMSAASDTVAGYKMAASDALLIWADDGQLVVRFVDPRVVDDDGVEIAAASDIAVSFSIQALFEGNIAPRSLDIIGPTATFMRLADGGYDIGIRTETRRDRRVSATEADAGPFIQALLEPPVEGEGETYLSEIRLSEATLTFIDEATESIVKAPRGTLIVSRTKTGLVATLDGQVSLPKGAWRFSAQANYERGAPTVRVDARLSDANLDALADAGPLFESLGGAEAPLTGTIQLVLDTEGRLRSADLGVTMQPGSVRIAALSRLPFEVASGDMRAYYDGETDTFELRRFALDSDRMSGVITGGVRLRRDARHALAGWRADLDVRDGRMTAPEFFDGETHIDALTAIADSDLAKDKIVIEELSLKSGETRFALSGEVTGLAAQKPGIRIQGDISALPLARIGTLWPKGVAEGARDWIMANARGGMITSGALKANLTHEDLIAERTPNDAARFDLNFEGVEIAYIDGLPPLTDVKGAALVLGDRFESRIASGRVGPIALSEGLVSIENFVRKGEPARISGKVDGSAADILKLLDMKPLGYPSRFGLAPASVKGAAHVDLALIVPTLKDLDVADIGFDVKASLRDISMPIAENIALAHGAAEFAVTGNGLSASGRGEVAGVPADFEWTEDFAPGPGEYSTHARARAVISEDMRVRLGVDPGAYLDGEAGVEVSMIGAGFDPVSASATVDLTAAALSVPELGYRKEKGSAATMTAELARAPDGFRAFPVTLKGEGIDAELDIALGPDGALRRVAAGRLIAGRNDVAFEVDLSGDQTVVTGDVATLDLDTLVQALSEPESLASSAQAEPAGLPAERGQSVLMRLKAKRVLLRGGQEAQNLRFDVDMRDGWLHGLLVNGVIEGGVMDARLTPLDDGRRQIVFQTDAMGPFVNGLTGFGSLHGGQGRLDLTMPPIGAAGVPTGAVIVRDVRLRDQPFFVRLLGAGSFTGLIDLMEGEGILFTQATADIALNGDRIELRNLKMGGPSAGATGEGFIDRRTDVIQARGALAPVYSLNAMLSDVPLIGDVLGGDGGVMALTFAIDGTVDDLSLWVNPFSVVAPGVLRDLFEFCSPLKG